MDYGNIHEEDETTLERNVKIFVETTFKTKGHRKVVETGKTAFLKTTTKHLDVSGLVK